MKTKAAMLWAARQDWQVEEIELGDPVAGEVQVRLAASGLCHSDEHLVTGSSIPAIYPVVGGHEGAGIVTKVGPGVSGLAEGDHIILGFIPGCGRCPACARGLQNLCDTGANLLNGRAISDNTHRIHVGDKPAAVMCLLGTFSPYVTVNQASVIKIEDDVPLDTVALLGCGVSTGWGSAAEIGATRPGEVAVIVGTGGVGMNAVQGAAAAGARFVVAVDPNDFKQEKAREFGATHTFGSMKEATDALPDLTWGRMADIAVITVGELQGEQIEEALGLVGKGGRVIATAVADKAQIDAKISLSTLTLQQKRLQGAIFGGVSPRQQIPNLLHMYRNGRLKLDELVTRTYSLEEINEGYQDMRDGKNLRGMIKYTDADY